MCGCLAVAETGKIPPGNSKDNDTWAQKHRAKPEVKLTPGKGTQDLTCSITDLIDQVVKSNKVCGLATGQTTYPSRTPGS